MELNYLLILSIVFCFSCALGSAWWYSKKQATTLRAAFLVLWQEGIVDGFSTLPAKIRPALKAAVATLRICAKRAVALIADYLRPDPVKHLFSPDLYYGLQAAISGYVYPAFQPVIDVRYTPAPSYIYVSLYTKAAVTEEVKAEVIWAVVAKFREYMATYALNFPHHVIPYVRDNFIELYLYYADRPVELPAYQAQVRRAMLMVAEITFRPLSEHDVPKVAGVVLGYELNRWQSTGQVVPIMWDVATAPHMMISGPTGGGKTVYVKLLLEQLLKTGATVTVCDFKGHNDLRGIVKNFAAGADCDALLARFCADFEKAREQDGDGRRRVLIFDEFGSYVASKEKKDFETLMRIISNLIFMGRSYGYSIILIAQRFDSETIRTSLREQFGVKVYMGSAISQQAATMLFPNSDLDKSNRLPPCCGYFSTPKTDLDTLTIPKIDIPALDRRLKALGEKDTE